jgi:short-subunit dehydrogenase
MRAVAHEFARNHHDLILAGRDDQELRVMARDLTLRYRVQVESRHLDLLDVDGHPGWVDAVFTNETASPAGVVLGVGYLGQQAIAERDFVEARRILETNFLGCVSLLNPIAQRLGARGGGFICVLSSVAGIRGRQSNYLYGSAKAGLSVYLQGLRNRLFRSGVQVTTVLPGFVDTPMTYGRIESALMVSPETIARGLYRAVRAGRDIVYLPWFWRGIMWVVASVPESIFKRLRF